MCSARRPIAVWAQTNHVWGRGGALMESLHTVQNATTRLVTGTRRRDHISPVLRQLHWLPVYQPIKFKMAVLVYKLLHGLAPQYLVEDCELVAAAEVPG